MTSASAMLTAQLSKTKEGIRKLRVGKNFE